MLTNMYGWIFYADDDQAGVPDNNQQTDVRPDTSDDVMQQAITDAVKEIDEFKDANADLNAKADAANKEVDESDAANAAYTDNPADDGFTDAETEFKEATDAVSDAQNAADAEAKEFAEAQDALDAANKAIESQKAEDAAEQAIIDAHNTAEAQRMQDEADAIAKAEADLAAAIKTNEDAVAAKQAEWEAKVKAELGEDTDVSLYKTVEDVNKELDARFDAIAKDQVDVQVDENSDVTVNSTATITVENVDGTTTDIIIKLDEIAGRDFTEDEINYIKAAYNPDASDEENTTAVNKRMAEVQATILTEAKADMETAQNELKTQVEKDHNDAMDKVERDQEVDDFGKAVDDQLGDIFDDGELELIKDDFADNYDLKNDKIDKFTGDNSVMDNLWDAKEAARINDLWKDYVDNFLKDVKATYTIDNIIKELTINDINTTDIELLLTKAIENGTIDLRNPKYVNFNDSTFIANALFYDLNDLLIPAKEAVELALEREAESRVADYVNEHNKKLDAVEKQVNTLTETQSRTMTQDDIDAAEAFFKGEDGELDARETMAFEQWKAQYKQWIEDYNTALDAFKVSKNYDAFVKWVNANDWLDVVLDGELYDDVEMAIIKEQYLLKLQAINDANSDFNTRMDAYLAQKVIYDAFDHETYNAELKPLLEDIENMFNALKNIKTTDPGFNAAVDAYNQKVKEYNIKFGTFSGTPDADGDGIPDNVDTNDDVLKPNNTNYIEDKDAIKNQGAYNSWGGPDNQPSDIIEVADGITLTGIGNNLKLTVAPTAYKGTFQFAWNHGNDYRVYTVTVDRAGTIELSVGDGNVSAYRLGAYTPGEEPVDKPYIEPPTLGEKPEMLAAPMMRYAPEFRFDDFTFDFKEIEDGEYTFDMDDFPEDFVDELQDLQFVYTLDGDDYYEVTITFDNNESITGFINIETGRFIVEDFDFDVDLVNLPDVPDPTDPDIWDDVPERVFPDLSFDRELPTLKVPTPPVEIVKAPDISPDPDPIIVDDDYVEDDVIIVNDEIIILDNATPLAEMPDLDVVDIEDADIPLSAMPILPPPMPEFVDLPDDDVPLAEFVPDEVVIINEPDVPLGDFPPEEELQTVVVIEDPIVPLAALPQTGVESLAMFFTGGLMVSAALTAMVAFTIRKNTKEKSHEDNG